MHETERDNAQEVSGKLFFVSDTATNDIMKCLEHCNVPSCHLIQISFDTARVNTRYTHHENSWSKR